MGPQEEVTLPTRARCPLGGSCNNRGSRCAYKLFSGWHQQAGARQRDSIKMVSTAYMPWEQLCRMLDVSQTLRPNKEFSFTERLGDVPRFAACSYTESGSMPKPSSPIAIVPWMQAPLATRARLSRGIPWPVGTKITAPDVCVHSFLLGETSLGDVVVSPTT